MSGAATTAHIDLIGSRGIGKAPSWTPPGRLLILAASRPLGAAHTSRTVVRSAAAAGIVVVAAATSVGGRSSAATVSRIVERDPFPLVRPLIGSVGIEIVLGGGARARSFEREAATEPSPGNVDIGIHRQRVAHFECENATDTAVPRKTGQRSDNRRGVILRHTNHLHPTGDIVRPGKTGYEGYDVARNRSDPIELVVPGVSRTRHHAERGVILQAYGRPLHLNDEHPVPRPKTARVVHGQHPAGDLRSGRCHVDIDDRRIVVDDAGDRSRLRIRHRKRSGQRQKPDAEHPGHGPYEMRTHRHSTLLSAIIGINGYPERKCSPPGRGTEGGQEIPTERSATRVAIAGSEFEARNSRGRRPVTTHRMARRNVRPSYRRRRGL